MIIMKFGGTSVGSAERIKNISNIIKSSIDKNPVVVVSAVTKITDELTKLARENDKEKKESLLKGIQDTHIKILRELGIDEKLLENDFNEMSELSRLNGGLDISDELLDEFQSFGEKMSSKIVAVHMNKIGINSRAFNAWELGLITDSEFGNAEPLDVACKNLSTSIKKLSLTPVITGFIGKTENGKVTTLGRGGSDYSAAIIGAAINAEEIQIWTDVNGIMSTDPKIVPAAKTLDKVSFAEASELAYFGARVLHPKTIMPAMRKGIPVRVLNSFAPKENGTLILNKIINNGTTAKSIACKKNITLINIESKRMLGAYGFLARLFSIFDGHRKSVDVVSTSEVSVSLTIDDDNHMDGLLEELKEIANVEILRNKSIICVVGEGMKNTVGIAGKTFSALGRDNINIEMISQGASEINITFIIDGKDTEKAVRTLHNEYFG